MPEYAVTATPGVTYQLTEAEAADLAAMGFQVTTNGGGRPAPTQTAASPTATPAATDEAAAAETKEKK